MWTTNGKNAQVQGVFDQVKNGATIVYYFNNEEIFTLEIPSAILQNGIIIFQPAETISLNSGRPNRAVLSGNSGPLMELLVPEELSLDPQDVIAGAVIKIERLMIQ